MELVKAIFLLILAGLTAFLFNYIHWRLQEKSKSILSAASTLLEYLNQVESEAITYWSKNIPLGDHQETSKKILEIKIKSLLKVTRKVLTGLLNNDLRNILSSEKILLSNFSSEIYDLVTGDSFEDDDVEQDLLKCAKISNRINDIKVIILKIINNNR